ncbi:hypothetical protein Bbelb_050490 [Branchiostoma belcheri]|nr:hypothetical protein Bbelb_050490 [Branchiostoma belcheri]
MFLPVIFQHRSRGVAVLRRPPGIAWAAFKGIFLSVAEAHAPITRKQVKEKGRPAPWLTDRVKNLMGQRDAARRKAIKTKDTKDWECYRSLRNQTTAMIKKAKKTHFESAITDAAEDPSLMWKIINNFTGKTASKGQVQKIRRSDESCTSEPAEMAEEFNKYFSSCAADLARDIPVSEEDPLRHVPESTSTFRLRPVEETEVLNELLRLKPKKATGVDKIPSRLLKDSAPIIVKPLAHIFNLSISSGEVPDDWKLAKVSPIYKSGNKDSVSNYRPVSVLNVASKVMEKMVHNQVSHFVNSTGQLTAHQSGFRKHHSTGSAVQKVVEDIQSAQNNQKVTVALFLDLRKAFDTVNHQILLGKLQKMGFDNGATNWFRVRTRTAMKQLLSFDPYMLDTPKANLETFKGSLQYQGPLVWNRLAVDKRQITSTGAISEIAWPGARPIAQEGIHLVEEWARYAVVPALCFVVHHFLVHPEAQPQNYMYMMDDDPEDQSEARPPGARKTHGWAG